MALEVLPFNGGKLLTKQFQFVEYHTPKGEGRLGCVVLISPPLLTPLERQMLRRVPENTSEMAITANPEGNTVVVVTLVVLAVAVTLLVTYYVHTEMVGYKVKGDDDASPAATNPEASARSLLEQRLAAIQSKRKG